MTRLVLDTNVVISGLLFGGPPGRLLERLWAGRFRLVLSAAILSEYSRALAYPRFGLRPGEVRKLVDGLLRPFSSLTAVEAGPPVCRDPGDDMFPYCAVAAQADAIVTGDRDIRAVGPAFQGIPILTVSDVLQQLGD